MKKYQYDVIIIGAGPGGYEAAIYAGKKGLCTAIIDKRSLAGGTCLHVGCIPSKTLLEATHLYQQATQAKHRGIESNTTLSLATLQAYKDKVVNVNAQGIARSFEKYGVTQYEGTASFIDPHKVTVQIKEGNEELTAKYIIIATGSKPTELPILQVDHSRIFNSDSILSLQKIPEKLAIIGGGVIGLEIGTVFKRLGSEIEIIERNDSILCEADASIKQEVTRLMRKQKIKVHTSTTLTGCQVNEANLVLAMQNKQGQEKTIEVTDCLVAVGRVPETDSLNLDTIGIERNNNGTIHTDENKRTNIETIYAIGDVTKGAMLAHKASNEGTFVIDLLCNETRSAVKEEMIPSVVYIEPEIAWIGKTQEQLTQQGIEYKKGSCLFRALGRSHASDTLDGALHILVEKETDIVVGMHIIGERAADLVAIGMVAIGAKVTAKELANLAFPHPTFSEAIKEAALGIER